MHEKKAIGNYNIPLRIALWLCHFAVFRLVLGPLGTPAWLLLRVDTWHIVSKAALAWSLVRAGDMSSLAVFAGTTYIRSSPVAVTLVAAVAPGSAVTPVIPVCSVTPVCEAASALVQKQVQNLSIESEVVRVEVRHIVHVEKDEYLSQPLREPLNNYHMRPWSQLLSRYAFLASPSP